MRLLRLDLGDVAVGVGHLRDGLLVVALRGEGVLHPFRVAAAVRARDLRGAARSRDAVVRLFRRRRRRGRRARMTMRIVMTSFLKVLS